MVSSIGATRMSWPQKTEMSYLMFWPILRTDGILKQRLQHFDGGRELDLLRAFAGEKVGLGAVAERDVAGLARRQRQRDADQLRRDRIEAVGFGVDRDMALRPRLGDPLVRGGRRR